MPDPIIDELWQAKDAFAREHNYDIDALVAALREKSKSRQHKTVNLENEVKVQAERG